MTAGRMHIAITADPDIPVPPIGYGGIERIIHFLVEGLHAAGHDVTLFAHRDSRVSCDLVPYERESGRSAVDTARLATTIARGVYRRQVDIIHSFGRLASLAPLALHPAPKFMSYQRAITPRSIRLARRLFGSSLEFTACSRQMIAPVETIGRWHVVYNGVPLGTYTPTAAVDHDAPLVFLGRVEHIKGTHLALEVARRTHRRLVIAGNIAPEHQQYFDTRIAPHLDGTFITYVGAVNDAEKNALLGKAAAMLMPILWEEPFGIVMAEALACGTPVIGLRRGAVPEVIRHGVTGWIADDVEGMVTGVERVSSFDRRVCRVDAEQRFSDRVIVARYEALYQSRLADSGASAA